MEKTLQVLNELERDGLVVRYAIGGAMAATFYVEPFLTFDLDAFIVGPPSPGPLYKALMAGGYSKEGAQLPRQ